MSRSVILSIFFLILTKGISLCEQTDLETALTKGEGKKRAISSDDYSVTPKGTFSDGWKKVKITMS